MRANGRTVDVELREVIDGTELFQSIGLFVDIRCFQVKQRITSKMSRLTPQLFEIRRVLKFVE